MLHLLLHALVPLGVSLALYTERWRTAWAWLMVGMLIDLDHLLADPIYDPERCSVAFHPLHGAPAIAIYALVALLPRTRLLGLGLLIHIALDSVDCRVNTGFWYSR